MNRFHSKYFSGYVPSIIILYLAFYCIKSSRIPETRKKVSGDFVKLLRVTEGKVISVWLDNYRAIALLLYMRYIILRCVQRIDTFLTIPHRSEAQSHVIVATAAWNYLWGKRSAQQQNPISVNSFPNIQCSHTGYSSPDFADRRRILLNICGGLLPLTANENTGWSSEQKAVSFHTHWSIHSWYDKIVPRFCVKLFSGRLISGQILNGLNIGFSLRCKFR